MLQKLKRYLLDPRSVTGVDLEIIGDNRYSMRFVTLREQRNNIRIVGSKDDFDLFEDVALYVDKKAPVHLCLDGKGVLHKKVENDGNLKNILQRVIPNAGAGDFVMELHDRDAPETYVSVIRKNLLQKILDGFREAGLYVTHVTLGPFPVRSVLPLINGAAQGGILVAGNCRIDLEEGNITGFTRMELDEVGKYGQVTIGHEMIDRKMLLAFAAAFSGLVEGEGIVAEKGTPWAPHREEWKEKRLYKLYSRLFTWAFFLIVLSCFFAAGHFRDENARLEEALYLSRDRLDRIDSLAKLVSEKEFLLGEVGWEETSRSSLLADQVAGTVPADIQLTEMIVHPPKENEDRSSRKVIYDPRVVLVSGACKASAELNTWMKQVRKLPWVREVAIRNYKQDKQDGVGRFILKIVLTE